MTFGLIAGSVVAQAKFGATWFLRSESDSVAADVGRVHGAALHALELRMAWTAGSLPGDVAFIVAIVHGQQITSVPCIGFSHHEFQLIGVNHRTAPVEVRERFAVSEKKLPEALQSLATSRGRAKA